MLSAGAGAMLALALAISAGIFGRRSLLLTTAAALVALASALRARSEHAGRVSPRTVERATALVLGVTIAASLVAHVVHSPSPENIPVRPLGFVLLAGVAVAVLGTFVPAAERVLCRWRVPVDAVRVAVWLACAAGMGIAVFRSVPAPFIDVWTFQQEAVGALLRGHDPYTHVYTNVFRSLAFFSPAIADLERVYVYPYPPLTILLGLPAYLLGGDVRYALLAALLVGAWAITRLAPGRIGALAAGAVLFHPRTFHVLDRAWTEPTVFAAAGLLLLALATARRGGRRGWLLVALAGALLLASKQYALLFAVPLAPLARRDRAWRSLAVGAVALGLVFVPFVLWDFAAFWRGVVAMQVLQPFRSDSLSWPAALVQVGGFEPMAPWIAFLAAVVAIVIAWPRGRRLAPALLCGVVGFLWFLLLGKQAFLNYYWLANALLFTVSALQVREADGATVAGVADDRR